MLFPSPFHSSEFNFVYLFSAALYRLYLELSKACCSIITSLGWGIDESFFVCFAVVKATPVSRMKFCKPT
jgi:hypothetical protein